MLSLSVGGILELARALKRGQRPGKLSPFPGWVEAPFRPLVWRRYPIFQGSLFTGD